ncbi:hypothetical protein EXIGLDRAFT_764521 [Exidia glandulosa HHB12029]|uniref:Uncharacterized protein n=1 Tax=Exidia glandulosa HHB12029 TaxID=1314781 RepID=A0A165L5Y7_EXIGL|nr:hypothetical protein EXIGLDRAFT_764521 [Exidia glandulosa HHB12029]
MRPDSRDFGPPYPTFFATGSTSESMSPSLASLLDHETPSHFKRQRRGELRGSALHYIVADGRQGVYGEEFLARGRDGAPSPTPPPSPRYARARGAPSPSPNVGSSVALVRLSRRAADPPSSPSPSPSPSPLGKRKAKSEGQRNAPKPASSPPRRPFSTKTEGPRPRFRARTAPPIDRGSFRESKRARR